MKVDRLARIASVLVVLLAGGDAAATTITFSVTPVVGNTFEYVYRVENDSLAIAIEEFTIFFDVDLFEDLGAPGSATGWDPLLVQPDPVLDDDGFVDWLVLAGVGEIAAGETLGGFTVRADYLGLGTPGSQFFEIRDANFLLLDTGFTVLVPEPGTGMLLVLGLAWVALLERSPK